MSFKLIPLCFLHIPELMCNTPLNITENSVNTIREHRQCHRSEHNLKHNNGKNHCNIFVHSFSAESISPSTPIIGFRSMGLHNNDMKCIFIQSFICREFHIKIECETDL